MRDDTAYIDAALATAGALFLGGVAAAAWAGRNHGEANAPEGTLYAMSSKLPDGLKFHIWRSGSGLRVVEVSQPRMVAGELMDYPVGEGEGATLDEAVARLGGGTLGWAAGSRDTTSLADRAIRYDATIDAVYSGGTWSVTVRSGSRSPGATGRAPTLGVALREALKSFAVANPWFARAS